MTEHELHGMWATARTHIITSQLAPTLLLVASIWLVMEGLGAQPAPIKLAAALVLLSGGILGALAQISAAGRRELSLTYLALLWAIFAPQTVGGMMPGQLTTVPG